MPKLKAERVVVLELEPMSLLDAVIEETEHRRSMEAVVKRDKVVAKTPKKKVAKKAKRKRCCVCTDPRCRIGPFK